MLHSIAPSPSSGFTPGLPADGHARWRFAALALLAAAVGFGGWLRFAALDAKSISHPEMYVPGIRLPEGAAEPSERLSLAAILTGTFSSDTHPPGYYIGMLPWTRAFGTSLEAIRLPSALLGTLSIPLLFWLGCRIGRRGAGAIAAALLAFNGYHVFWSKTARMFSMACFLGLLATILLLLIADGGSRRRILMFCYALVLLAGVATHVFFWALFATHILWCLLQASDRGRLPDISRVQLLVLIAGSPLIAFAGYQSGNTVANLSDRVLLFFGELARFAFLFPNELSGVFPVPLTGMVAAPWFVFGKALFLGIAVALLGLGLRSLMKGAAGRVAAGSAEPPSRLWYAAWLAAAVCAALAIGLFVHMTHALPPDRVNTTLRITQALVPLPLVLAGVAFVLERRWAFQRSFLFWGSRQGLVVMLAFVPAALISAVSLVRPFLNQRGMLFVGPYVLLLLGVGVTALPRRAVLMGALVVLLAAAHGASLAAYAPMTVDPADVTAFAAALRQQAGAYDLVFVHKAWYATPILYYLPPDRYQIFARNFSQACHRHPDARVWVVLLYETDAPLEMKQALTDYRVIRTIEGPRARAILYGAPEKGRGYEAALCCR